MEILCNECGHPLKEHGYKICFHELGKKGKYLNYHPCDCTLGSDAIEARYFAKYFYKKYKTTDKIRAQLLEQYWELAGKYLEIEQERKILENKVMKATKALDKIARKTDDTKIAGIASDAMAEIVILKRK